MKGRVRTGLRVRIAATIAAIVLVAVAALGVAVHLLVVSNRVSDARTAAAERMNAAVEIYRSTGLLSFDAKADAPLPDSLRKAVRHDGSHATLVRGHRVRTVWAASRSGDTVLSTKKRFEAVNGTVRAVDRALIGAGIATVLLAMLVGALSANQLARRLRVAARTARGMAAGGDPISVRRAVGRRRDEVGDLADAVDTLADQLESRIDMEQRFSADVAHDLRTPVTGLVTAAALLDDSRPAELVRNRSEALRRLVEDLLEVSRLDRGAEIAEFEQVRLDDTIKRIVARGVDSGEYTDGAVTVHADDGRTAVTDPRRLERVVNNLIRNALQHGRPPVEVTVARRKIVVRDHGPGFDQDVLDEGPRRFRSARSAGSDGNGLGLVIAAGQAAVLGASLTFGNHPDGGAQAVLLLSDEAPGARVRSDITAGSQTSRENETRP